MADAALQKLKADLKNQAIGSFYVFCGEEAYLREYYLDMLIQKLTAGTMDAFNFHRFDSQTLNFDSFGDAVEAMPMMAPRTLIRIDDVDFFKMDEQSRTRYGEILSDIPDYCCVVLDYDTVPYKPNGTMRKLADVFKKNAQVIQFDKQSDRDLAVWVCRHFKAQDKTVSDELCKYLVFITDGMMTTLHAEIEKICAFCSGSAVTRSDIDAVVVPALNAQTFDISNAICDGDYEKALVKMQTLFAMQEECIPILGAISSQLRRLLYARMITAAGGGQQTLMELTSMQSYAAGLTMTAARRVSDRFCETAMQLCMDTDRKLKTSSENPERLLELLVVQLAQEARRA